ncbi:MAG: response regulator [Myxococcaceae bacterium]|nr:response regulator [Myxococcaceae bacterium]
MASGESTSSWFERLVDRLVPAGLTGPEASAGRLFVKAWLPVFPFCLGTAPIFAAAGSWPMVGALGVAPAIGAAMLALFRRTGKVALPAHVSLLTGSLLFAASGLLQRPPDPTAPTILVVIPLVAAFVLGRRWGWAYLAFCLLVVVLELALVSAGVALAYEDTAPVVTQGLNYLFALTMVLMLTGAADQLRVRVIAQQQAAAETKSQFLANIGHEIRTPMNGVLGMTEELLASSEVPAATKERLAVIQRSGQHMVALLNDLLDLSRIEAGKLVPAPRPTELRWIIDDVGALFAPLAKRKGVSFESRCEADVPPWVLLDGARLQQVLTNLVSNAVKFTERGAVSVRVALKGQALEFSVTDTGIGIDAADLPRLFAAFEQVDASTTRRHEGSGLGLALSKQLVTLLGGALTVDSRPGLGSCFQFTLPMTASGPVAPATAQGRLSVLVVDDNPINRRVAEGLLQRAGHQVQSVTNGLEALEVLERRPVDAILMDCHMPVMDGFEATERIRALAPPSGRTPIIAVTASASADDVEACQRSGMNAYLAKPVSFAELMNTLERVTRAG